MHTPTVSEVWLCQVKQRCCCEVLCFAQSEVKRATRRASMKTTDSCSNLSFSGTGSRTRTCTIAHWNLNPTCLPIPPYPHILLLFRYLPVAVPDKIFASCAFLDFIDRCHSLRSLHPPLAAPPNSTIPALLGRSLLV